MVDAPVKATADPPASRTTASWRILGYALLALLVAFAQLRLIVLLVPQPFRLSALAAEGILRGEPHWRVYQSRVLGPLLIEALGGISGTFLTGYVALAVLALFAAGLGVLVSCERLADRRRPPLAAFFLLHLTIVFLLPSIFLYPWDLLALPVFVAFNHLVLRGAHPGWFTALFCVAVLNHEIALWIAAWLVLDPTVHHLSRRGAGGRTRFAFATALLGVGLGFAGVAVIEGLRTKLMVREVLSDANVPELASYGGSFHLTLAENWRAIAASFTLEPASAFPFVVVAFLVLVAVLALRLAAREGARGVALAGVMLGMLASFLMFGLVLETRVLMPLAPFLAMNAGAAFGRSS